MPIFDVTGVSPLFPVLLVVGVCSSGVLFCLFAVVVVAFPVAMAAILLVPLSTEDMMYSITSLTATRIRNSSVFMLWLIF